MALLTSALIGAGGLAAGSLLSSWLGGGGETKKEAKTQQATTSTIEPYAFYSPSTSNVEAWQYQPSVMLGSPHATQTPTATKKETITQETIPTISPSIRTSPTSTTQQRDEQSIMDKFLPILLIGGAGLVLYEVIK